MKLVMAQTLCSTRSCMAKVLKGAPDDVFVALRNPESIARTLRRYRNKLLNPGPILFRTLKIGYTLAVTHRNELFYQYGPDNRRGIESNINFCLFFSNYKYNLLKESSIICVDGTFSVVPTPYYQLFTISMLNGVNVIPVVYALLPNKELATYLEVYRVLELLEGSFTPTVVKTDFELASITALMRSFPGIEISGCQFHLGQNLSKKLKEFNLWYRYLESQIVKKFTKSLIALSYVRQDLVYETFMELRNDINFPILLNPIYDYFLRTYIGNERIVPRFPIHMWNQVDETHNYDVPRTNNAIEGWHRVFASTFGTSNYNLIILIYRLIEEEEVIHQKLQWIGAGYSPRRRDRYVLIERRVNEFLTRHGRDNFGVQFLFSLVDLLFY